MVNDSKVLAVVEEVPLTATCPASRLSPSDSITAAALPTPVSPRATARFRVGGALRDAHLAFKRHRAEAARSRDSPASPTTISAKQRPFGRTPLSNVPMDSLWAFTAVQAPSRRGRSADSPPCRAAGHSVALPVLYTVRVLDVALAIGG